MKSKSLLKSIISLALAIVLVMGALPIDGLVMVARADGSALVSDSNDGWKHEIASGGNETLDLTSDDKATNGFQFHLKALGASGSIHIKVKSGYVLRVQGNVYMNMGDGEICYYNGENSQGEEIAYHKYVFSSSPAYYDHSSSGNNLYIEYSELGSPYFDFTVTVIDPSVDLSYATITGVENLYIYTGAVIPVSWTVRDGGGNDLTEGTDYTATITKDGAISEVVEPGDYTLTISAAEGSGISGTKSVGFRVNKGLTPGQETNTYLISSQDDWTAFAELVEYGFDFSGKTVKLSADIVQVDRIGTSKHPFSGTFDGGGKKITTNNDGVFYYINGATIQNLWVDQGNGNNVFIKNKTGSGRNVMKNVLFTTKGDEGYFCYGALSSCTNVYGTFTDSYGNGIKVTATPPAEGLYRSITAANGSTYYIPATVSGIQDSYVYTGSAIPLDCLVMDTSGKTLTAETDYTVAIQKDDSPVDAICEAGSYTATFSGTGNYSGTQSFRFTVAAPSADEINSWAALQTAMAGSGTKIIRLTGDIEASANDSALTVPDGLTVNLDLAGFTIDRKLTAETENGNVITVSGKLIITDSGTNGAITGGWSNYSTGGGIHVKAGGSLTLRGGTIRNNTTNDGYGGGVCVEENGTFTMSGGTISGNTAEFGGGVYLDNYSGGSAFIMTGGTISNNTATVEAGGVGGNMVMSGNASITGNTAYGRSAVYCDSFAMSGNASITNNHSTNTNSAALAVCASKSATFSGNVRITGNTNGEDIAANIAVNHSMSVRISGTLTGNALIGVTSWSDVSSDAPVVFTEGLSGFGGAKNFSSDQGYIVSLTGNGEAMLTGDTVTFYRHGENHNWGSYSQAGDVYYEYRRVCVERGGKVTKPADPTYDSDDMGLTFSGWFLDADCTKPYDFDSAVTGSFALYQGWQRTLLDTDVTLADGIYTYNGDAIMPEITVTGILSTVYWNSTHPTGTLTQDRDYTVEYTDNVNAGTVTVTVTGKRIHKGTVTRTFEIGKREVTVSGITAEDKAYDGTKAAELIYTGVTFDNKLEKDTLTVSATGTFVDANAGDSKTVTISGLTLGGEKAGNYVLSESGQQTGTSATIRKKDLSITAKDQSIYVGGTVPTLSGEDFYTVTGLVGEETLTAKPTLAYQKAGSAATPDNTVAGTYDIVPSGAKASDNYTISHVNGTLTISEKPAATVKKAPVAKTLTYNGSAQELVTAGEADGGEMQYALGTETEATQPYTTSIPAKTDVGTYYVWYKVVGDENHLDTQAACVTASIAMPEFGEPDFVMPGDLTAIEESAFEGVASMTVVDAHTCAAIGKDAFKGTGLKQIRLPKDCEISDAAFDEDGLIYVYAPTDGTTQAYCNAHDHLVFVAE